MADTNDILLDEDFDIIIENGDFKIGDATLQNQQLLLLCEKSEFKQNPTVCIGLNNWILDEADPQDLLLEIIKQFEMDGMQIDSINNTEVKAHYI